MGVLLWRRQWTFGRHRMLIMWIGEQLLASQEILSYMELVFHPFPLRGPVYGNRVKPSALNRLRCTIDSLGGVSRSRWRGQDEHSHEHEAASKILSRSESANPSLNSFTPISLVITYTVMNSPCVIVTQDCHWWHPTRAYPTGGGNYFIIYSKNCGRVIAHRSGLGSILRRVKVAPGQNFSEYFGFPCQF
jgi:hypothetical protein